MACFLMALAIGMGAFGHHVLAHSVPPSRIVLFETASRYLMFGGIWLLVLTKPAGPLPQRPIQVILSGVLLFSGALLAYLALPIKVFMLLVPVGGVTMMAGFVMLGLQTRSKRT